MGSHEPHLNLSFAVLFLFFNPERGACLLATWSGYLVLLDFTSPLMFALEGPQIDHFSPLFTYLYRFFVAFSFENRKSFD